MIEGQSGESLDRRNFLKGLIAVSASIVVPAGLVEKASTQETMPEKPYEKQEPKIPSAVEIDKMVHSFAKEKGPDGLTQSISVLENRIFSGGDAMAGVKAFEYTNGIDPNLNLLRGRAQYFKQDTKVIDEIHEKAMTLRTAANEAYIDFLHDIPTYVQLVTIGLKTDWNAENMHKNVLTIAKANDALVQIRDEVRKITPQR